MRLISFLKPGLLIFECVRVLFIVLILVLQGNDPGLLTRIVLAAPSALFPLMALFICLDFDRYKEYLPLYMAGKSIGIFLQVGWSIISRQVTMIGGQSIPDILAQLILSGDLFAIAAVLIIIKSIQKPDMEEK